MSQIELFELRRGLFQPSSVEEQIAREKTWQSPTSAAVDRLKLWENRLGDPFERAKLGEQKHKQTFLRDLFEGLLSYQTAGSSDPYHLEFELSGPTDTRLSDGALGLFGRVNLSRVRAVIEVKSPGIDLEARSNRKDNLSAVDQAFLYASHQDNCWWVIVSNFDEIRLYQHQRGTAVYERWVLGDILRNSRRLVQFAYLLHRDHLLGDAEEKPVSLRLAEQKWRAQADISKKFYVEYQEARLVLFEQLREQNESTDPGEILEATQLLLDRLLFIMFCSDRGLLPRDVVKRLLQTADPKTNYAYTSITLWLAVKGLFDAINLGRQEAAIPGYNGGLFAPSKLDELVLHDQTSRGNSVLRRILGWDQLDFESQIDVDILGHIFENSISDLEQLRAEINSDPHRLRLSWRNREGIFYTPEWVTRYIVHHTVGRYLEEHPEVGPDLKVVDPACGSGAFLTQLIPLFGAHIDQLAPKEMEVVRNARSERELTLFQDPTRLEPEALYAVIQRTIFGVDKSHESVEITKLSFWLKTVVRGHALPKLEDNVLTGNALCDDSDKAEDAFLWEDRLPQVASAGADVIIGNPPWVDEVEYEACLKDKFRLSKGSYDLAFLFIERALDLLKPGGYVGFIVPDSVLINEETEKVRRLLVEEHTVQEVIKLGEGVFPGVYRGSVILIVQKGKAPEGHVFSGLVVTKADRNKITDLTDSVNLDVLMAKRGNSIRLARVLENPRLELDVFVGEEDETLMGKIEDRKIDWDCLIEHGRGVELNSAGHVIRCPHCFLWDAPPAKLKGVYRTKQCSHCGAEYEIESALGEAMLIAESTDLNEGEEHFLDGTDVNRYRLAGRRKINVTKEGIAYKERELYRSPKIVFRQAGIGITATIDYDLSAYVPQSVYVFRLRDNLEGDIQRYKLEYLLGVLNSRVMLYWYFKRTGQVEWQSYPRWTLGRVIELPVRAIDWSNEREVEQHDRIAEMVEELIRKGASGNPEEDLAIERVIMNIYGLSSGERQRIWATLSGVQELKIIREVLPPTQVAIDSAV